MLALGTWIIYKHYAGLQDLDIVSILTHSVDNGHHIHVSHTGGGEGPLEVNTGVLIMRTFDSVVCHTLKKDTILI